MSKNSEASVSAVAVLAGRSWGRREKVWVGVGGRGWGSRSLGRAPLCPHRWGRAAVFGLPGNPTSALVTFELFVRPALRALAGLRGSGRLRGAARLGAAPGKPAGPAGFPPGRHDGPA